MQAGAASSSPLSLLLPLSFCLSFTRRKLFCGVSRLTGYGNPGGAPAWKLMKLRNEEEKRETRCWRCVAEAGLVLVSSVLFFPCSQTEGIHIVPHSRSWSGVAD